MSEEEIKERLESLHKRGMKEGEVFDRYDVNFLINYIHKMEVKKEDILETVNLYVFNHEREIATLKEILP